MARKDILGILGAIALLALVLGVAYLGLAHQSVQTAHASGFAIPCYDSTELFATTSLQYNRACNGLASTSPTYLTTAASSTVIQNNIAGADTVTINIQAVGSSTSSILNWTYNLSWNGIDWYQETLAAAALGVNTVRQGGNAWTLGTATSSISQVINPLGARYIQIVESMSGAAGDAYTQIMPRVVIPN